MLCKFLTVQVEYTLFCRLPADNCWRARRSWVNTADRRGGSSCTSASGIALPLASGIARPLASGVVRPLTSDVRRTGPLFASGPPANLFTYIRQLLVMNCTVSITLPCFKCRFFNFCVLKICSTWRAQFTSMYWIVISGQ